WTFVGRVLARWRGSRPFTCSALRKRYAQLMAATIGEIDNILPTVHWDRVTLACQLLAGKRPDGVIQALVRWKSVEAMNIYASLTPREYASYITEALLTDASRTDPSNLPTISAQDAHDHLSHAVATLSNAPPKPKTLDTAANPAVPSATAAPAAAAPTPHTQPGSEARRGTSTPSTPRKGARDAPRPPSTLRHASRPARRHCARQTIS
ncbi:MAG: hypothetical protein SGPRY_006442, partial [Prymnesium sp.]